MTNFHPVSASLGRTGSTYVTDTSAHTGNFGIIQALEATVIAAMTSATDAVGTTIMSGTLTNIAVPAGVSIYGHFTSVTLASGRAILYNI